MAQKNLAVLETYLKDIIYSKETIESQVENREHIFEITDSEKVLGFISLYDLKAYVLEHEEEAKNYFIKNIDSDQWKNIFEHPFFQRRKPQLISTESLKDVDDSEFFILSQGQKIGPYERSEITEKVQSKEILLTDMVSTNGGHTWIKLYQVDGFERRTLRNNDQLPGMPSSTFLNRPIETVNNFNEMTEGISSLAFLGNQKRGKTLEREREITYHDEVAKGASTSSIYKWLLIASVIGIVYFLFNIKTQLNSPFSKTNAPVGEQAEMLTPTDMTTTSDNSQNTDKPKRKSFNSGVNDQRRRAKFETRSLPPVRPARKSFMETNRFTDSAPDSNGEPSGEDTNYFYDNASPMELDPVRAQISKENFDNGGEPGPAPEADSLFSSEASN